MKKFTALLLVLVLVLSLSVSAFAAKSKTVYVTGSGKVYHEKECPNTWNGRYKTTIEEAEKLGLKPCDDCCPPEYDPDDEETNQMYIFVLMGDDEYHCCDCEELWEEDVWTGTSMTLKKAQSLDLKPCGYCHPEEGTQKSTVYQISETGAYHTCDCRIIWHARFKTTLSALDDSARPCSYCHGEN